MTVKKNSKNLGTLPLTVLKISKNTVILVNLVTFEFKPENALDIYNFLKMDLLKIPNFLKNEIITQKTAYKYIIFQRKA